MKTFDVPETPLDKVAAVKARMTRMWELEDLDLNDPVIFGTWEREDDGRKAPDVNTKIQNWDVDLEEQLRAARRETEHVEAGFCNLPSIWPYVGVTVIPSAFGCKVLFREGDQPACYPLFHEPEDVARLEPPDVSRAGQCADVLERIDRWNEATGGKIPIRCTDTQDPIDVATQIWHYDDMLTAMFTHPEAVHRFMQMVTDALIEFTRLQVERIDNLFAYGHSGLWRPHGIHLSDDVAAVLSPRTYEEFARPYNEQLADAFGGAVYHCCLGYEQNLPAIAASRGFMGFDPDPEHNSLDVIEQTLTGRGVWCRALAEREYIDRFRGKFGMYLNAKGKTRDEALEKAKQLAA